MFSGVLGAWHLHAAWIQGYHFMFSVQTSVEFSMNSGLCIISYCTEYE